MNGNVNPFEPWRPPGCNVPPRLHVGRPWRPPVKPAARVRFEEPPLVEPVEKPARKQAPARPKRRAPVAARTPSTPLLRTDQNVVLGMLFALSALGLWGLAWLGDSHLPRVFVTLLAAAAGFICGISLARRRTWFVRLGWMAGGLALAALAGWFVPTTRGVNLWSAYQQVDELRALPAGDVSAYKRGGPYRKQVVSEFPTFAEDIAAAERGWLRRTVDAAIEDADRKMPNHPGVALADLHQWSKELSQLDHYGIVKDDLEAAQKRVLEACKIAAR